MYQTSRAGSGLPSGNAQGPAPPSLPRAGRNSRRGHSRGSKEETGTLRTQGWLEQQRVVRASPTAHAPRPEFFFSLSAPPPPSPKARLSGLGSPSAHVHQTRSRLFCSFSGPLASLCAGPVGAPAHAPPPDSGLSFGAALSPLPRSLRARLAWPAWRATFPVRAGA